MAEALDPALPPEVDRLAKAVLRRACDRRRKLATAESWTGGLLASLLTDVPGMSHAVERGFGTYTHAAKHEMLGVAMEILGGGMTSRLFREVREKRGLVYSVSAMFAPNGEYGAGYLYAGTSPEKSPDTVKVLLDELRL